MNASRVHWSMYSHVYSYLIHTELSCMKSTWSSCSYTGTNMMDMIPRLSVYRIHISYICASVLGEPLIQSTWAINIELILQVFALFCLAAQIYAYEIRMTLSHVHSTFSSVCRLYVRITKYSFIRNGEEAVPEIIADVADSISLSTLHKHCSVVAKWCLQIEQNQQKLDIQKRAAKFSRKEASPSDTHNPSSNELLMTKAKNAAKGHGENGDASSQAVAVESYTKERSRFVKLDGHEIEEPSTATKTKRSHD